MMIIMGNTFAIINGLFCLLSTFARTKKKLLLLQIIDCTANIAAYICLMGYSGAIMAICSLIRNIICYKRELSKIHSIFLVAGMGLIAILVNNKEIYGLLPVIAVVLYSIGVCFFTKIQFILIMMCLQELCQIPYNLIVQNYGSIIFNIILILSAIYNLGKQLHKNVA